MKGSELNQKFQLKNLMVTKMQNHKISALDLGIKRNIPRNLAKEMLHKSIFPYNASFEDLQSNPDVISSKRTWRSRTIG
jgi:carbamoyl-phosphate synthase small subunit